MADKALEAFNSRVLFKDRLLREAYDALSTLYSARRRLVAFTGSGLSLIYGGLTWDEAVNAIADDTHAEISVFLASAGPAGSGSGKKPISPASQQILMRFQTMIEVYLGGGKTASQKLDYRDKMVALEICDDARRTLRSLGHHIDTANEFFARLVEGDFLATRMRLADRFSGYHSQAVWPPVAKHDKRKEAIETYVLPPATAGGPPPSQDDTNTIAVFAARAYSTETLDELAKRLPRVADTIRRICSSLMKEMMEAGFDLTESLPVDRRSTLAPFLALLPDAARLELADGIRAKAGVVLRPPVRPLTDPLRQLADPMRIKRFMTLNYDWELERLLMLPDRVAETDRAFTIEAIKGDLLEWGAPHSGRMMKRRMPDGRYMTSEVYEPNASARLFEFALNSPDHAADILHLHGRADFPEGMVAREPDYHRTYRRESSNPRALERALDVALTGNPILFVGISLQEAEITRAFRQLVAEGRVTPERPAFALMPNSQQSPTAAWREQAASYQQFGLHILPYGHPRRGAGFDLPKHLELVEQLKVLARNAGNPPGTKIPAEASDIKLAMVDEKQFAILGSMTADLVIVQWIASIVRNPRSAKRRLSDLVDPVLPLDDAHRARAASGMVDYLERLRSRLISQALSLELGELASDISRNVDLGEKPLSPREEATLAETDTKARQDDLGRPTFLWLRHIAVSNRTASVPPTRLRLDNEPATIEELLSARPTAVVIGPQHAGKGALMRQLAQGWIKDGPDLSTLMINLTFAVEVDGVIALIWQVFMKLNLFGPEAKVDDLDRLDRICDAVQKGHEHAVCRLVLTGLERLFDPKGACIAPDLDRLLQALLLAGDKSPVRLVLVGTPVLERWLERIEPAGARVLPPVFRLQSQQTAAASGIGASFNATLKKALEFSSADLATRIGYRQQVVQRQPSQESKVRMLLEIVLDHWRDILVAEERRLALQTPLYPSPPTSADKLVRLDLAALRFLSFVTAPVERSILAHVPAVKVALRDLGIEGELPSDQAIEASLDRLTAAGLAIQIQSKFVPAGHARPAERRPRYALHRVVLKEMRDRLGVPIGDAILSNTFTLTLAASLPADVSIPDDDIRREMEAVLSHLRGAWKDRSLDKDTWSKLEDLRTALVRSDNPHDSGNWQAEEMLSRLRRYFAMTTVDMHAALRASCNLIRSFFSATTLVMLSPKSVDSSDPATTPFDQYKQMIRKTFVTLAELQVLDEEPPAPAPVPSPAPSATPAVAAASPAALNRLGRTLDDIEKFGEDDAVSAAVLDGPLTHLRGKIRDYREEAKLYPLYGGEIVWLHNERGVISLIQGDLYEASYSFDRALAANTGLKGEMRGNSRNRIDVNRSLLLIERGQLSEARSVLHEVREDLQTRIAREKSLLMPITEGYLGLIAHLNGRTDDASRQYTACLEGLVATEQLRALSLFHMRRASLNGATGDLPAAMEDVSAAIRSAEACCQIDVLWRARLLRSAIDTSSRDRDHVSREAFIAAERLGLARVSVEALMTRAEAAIAADNLDLAADLTAQAMARATRWGMTLRRIALRVLMGKIMLRQGTANGEWLIRRAIAHADRIGYQSCVQNAQEALLRLGSRGS